MRTRIVTLAAAALAVATLAAAAPAAAQDLVNSACPRGAVDAKGLPDPTRVAQDGCQQAYDIYQFVSTQLGMALTGGSATLGTGGTLGGLGHFSLGVRANVFHGAYPALAQVSQSVTGVQRQTLPTKDQVLGLPTADLALGIFKGFDAGATRLGGLDALISATYVPTLTVSDYTLAPASHLRVGYGARLGLLAESMVAPGLSLTWLERDLPETSIEGTSGDATLRVTNASVKTHAWRVTASKTFLLFGLAAGAGQDTYVQTATISATVNENQYSGSTTVPGTAQRLIRTNYFADASIDLPLFKIVGEIGNVSGGVVETYNTFSSGRVDRPMSYGSAGIRVAW